ncbi:hypothetical protein R3P38DRAFT_2845556 [Favolaschia claudopus]|uniref:Uncharacterized protein n=1 Tax=Favolaschia claudopus TaxID=2862362 RepID=A0AAW0DQU7_9AGAR
MSSPLIDWTAAQLSALYSPKHTAPNESPKLDLDLSAFAPDAEIRLNHAKVELKKEFLAFVESRRSVTAGVECQMDDVVETAVEEGNDAVRLRLAVELIRRSQLNGAQAGKIVAGKATLVRTHPFLMRAAPMKTQTILIFSAK